MQRPDRLLQRRELEQVIVLSVSCEAYSAAYVEGHNERRDAVLQNVLQRDVARVGQAIAAVVAKDRDPRIVRG